MNRLKKVALGVVIVLGVTGIIGSCSGSGGDEVDIKQLQGNEFTMEQKVSAALGKETRDFKFNNGVLMIDLDKVITLDLTRMDVKSVVPRLYLIPEVQEVRLNYYSEMIDSYGNTTESVIYWVNVDRELYDKINWDTFDERKLEVLAEEWIHPSWK